MIDDLRESAAPPPPEPPAPPPPPNACPLCGTAMYGVHCKLVCPHCGYREDCSDLFPA